MGKYIDAGGLSHFMGVLKGYFVRDVNYDSTNKKITKTKGATTSDVVAVSSWASSTSPKMNGTAAVGSETTTFARGDHVHPTDTSRAASTHAHGNITNGGDITAAAPTIASGDKLVINDESASKITNGPAFGTSTTTFLRNDGTWAAPSRYTDQEAVDALETYAEEEGKVLLSSADYTPTEKTKLAGISAGAEVNVQADWNQSTTTADDYIKNKPTLGAAAAKGVDTSIASGSASANLPTTAAVVKYVGEVAGALVYKGTVSAASGMANFKAGWFWIAADSFDIGSGTDIEHVEPGDMLIANVAAASATAANIDVVQTNIDTLSNDEIDALWAAA